MRIEFVDLKSQYKKIKTEIDTAIQEVIDNTAFIKGPQIKQFEESLAAYLQVKHVISCANGTDALQIAMMALDLKPGDEIILPVFTYVATAEVIALLGLKPVMVDVEPDTFCINTDLIEAKISDRTKAIVPVHLFGQCANMDAIMQLATKYNLFVIEDTAQALGAKWQGADSLGEWVKRRKGEREKEIGFDNFPPIIPSPLHPQSLSPLPPIIPSPLTPSTPSSPCHPELSLPRACRREGYHLSSPITHLSSLASAGCMGTIGTTSFFPSKNLGCYGDGGALMTNDDELAKKIRMICNHGQSVQYVHDVIGVNSRLDTLQAAVLNAKLPYLDSYAAARQEAAGWYDELLGNHPNIIIPKRNPNSTHVFHQYTIIARNEKREMRNETLPFPSTSSGQAELRASLAQDDREKWDPLSFRDSIRKAMAERGIPTMVYYPIELHKQKAFEKYALPDEKFPVSEELCATVLSLPMHTEMSKEMVAYICRNLIEVIEIENRKSGNPLSQILND